MHGFPVCIPSFCKKESNSNLNTSFQGSYFRGETTVKPIQTILLHSLFTKANIHQDSLGFHWVWTLASAHVLHLPTNSVQIFWMGRTSDFGLSQYILTFTGEHRWVMKLEVQPLELAFGVDSQDRQGGQGFSSIRYASWCKSIFQMHPKTHG